MMKIVKSAVVSATPYKDKLWDLIASDGPGAVIDELMSYISDDDAYEVCKSLGIPVDYEDYEEYE